MFFLNFFLFFYFLIFVNANAANINIIGNKNIEAKTVKLYAKIDENQTYTISELSEALKNIYATGFFSSVKIDINNSDINIHVQETPIITKIEFNGSKAIGRDKMIEELTNKEKRFFSKTNLLNDVKRLTLIYQKLGFLNVKIKPLIEFQKNEGQIILIFDIREGKKTQIAKIDIVGNKYFSKKKIKEEAIKIRQRSLFKFNFGASFDSEAIQNERENIIKFYKTNGFPNIVLENIVSKYNEKKNLFYITYFINEGKKHKFGKSIIENFVENFDDSKIKQKNIKTTAKKIYNIENIQATVAEIQEILQQNGFMFAQVEYSEIFQDGEIVDIKYTLKNARRIYLHRIEFAGNEKTSEEVLRREFIIKEGDIYDITKIRRSIQRLYNLQYFDDVQMEENLVEGTQDRMIIKIKVKERSTASINASVGYDQINRLSGSIGVNESNFLGEGYNAGVNFEKTMVSQNYGFSFSNPYFKNRNILLGFNLSKSEYGNPRFLPYNSNTSQISFVTAYSITEYLRHTINYRYQLDDIATNSSSTSPFVLAQLGNYKTSAISHSLMYDKRDNNFIPNSGYSFTMRQEVAGLGGNVKFLSNEIRSDYYKTLFFDGLVLGLKGRVANIQGIGGGKVNIQNLYSLGGGFGMRGFNYRGIGPTLGYLDSNGNVTGYEAFSYGGKNLQLYTAELRFPNLLPKDFGLVTYLFTDVGTLYGMDLDTSKISASSFQNVKMFDDKMYRVSTGLGVSWRSPMGPIGFAFGKAIKSAVYDQKLFFLITFGGMGQMF